MTIERASDNPFPSILLVEGDPEDLAANPASGQRRLAVGTDHLLYLVDDSGVKHAVGGGLIDPMTTRGDILVRNASNVTARLGRGSAGQVLGSDGTDIGWVAAAGGDLAGKELDYVAKTSNTSVTATSEATADTVVTGSAVTYDGSTIVLVEFWCDHMKAAGSQDLRIWLYDGSSSIGFIAYTESGSYVGGYGVRRITPSNASHTYSVRASVSGGTGVIAAGAGGSGAVAPAFIRITKV